jgi:polyphosphate kinase
VPPLLPRFVAVPGSSRFVALEQVIAAHLDALFPGMEVLEHYAFRVTRDADFQLSDDAEDLLAAMEVVLRQRTKFGVAVRLEVDADMTSEVLQLLCRELELGTGDVYVIDGPLDLSGLMGLYALRRPELKFEAFTPQTPPALAGGDDVDIFWACGRRRLLHRPARLVASTVLGLRRPGCATACAAIKQTLYPPVATGAGIVASLVKAAARRASPGLALVSWRVSTSRPTSGGRMLGKRAHVVYGLYSVGSARRSYKSCGGRPMASPLLPSAAAASTTATI